MVFSLSVFRVWLGMGGGVSGGLSLVSGCIVSGYLVGSLRGSDFWPDQSSARFDALKWVPFRVPSRVLLFMSGFM